MDFNFSSATQQSVVNTKAKQTELRSLRSYCCHQSKGGVWFLDELLNGRNSSNEQFEDDLSDEITRTSSYPSDFSDFLTPFTGEAKDQHPRQWRRRSRLVFRCQEEPDESFFEPLDKNFCRHHLCTCCTCLLIHGPSCIIFQLTDINRECQENAYESEAILNQRPQALAFFCFWHMLFGKASTGCRSRFSQLVLSR